MPLRRQKHILSTDRLVAHRGGGDVEDTCRTYYRTFVHIQSIGRYDSIGATCHRESDKKCTVGDFVSSIVLGHLPRAEAESHRLSSTPRPLSSSTLFLLVIYHERNLQPLAEGEFCNGTSFCLRQEPVSSYLRFFLYLVVGALLFLVIVFV